MVKVMLGLVLPGLNQIRAQEEESKLSQKEVDYVKKNAFDLIQSLTEYAQRADLVTARRGVMQVAYGGRKAELVLLGTENFLVEGTSIKKISDGAFTDVTKEEFEKALAENKGKLSTQVSGSVFKALEKALGTFEITF